MRRALLVVAAIAGLSLTRDALAQAGALMAPVTVRVGPGLRFAPLAYAPAGSEIVILHATRRWAWAVVNGARGYVARAELAFLPAPPAPESCDQSYPYSGSGAYFGGLTALRHSAPLSALLGTHVRPGC